jgi:hypothetical protein
MKERFELSLIARGIILTGKKETERQMRKEGPKKKDILAKNRHR